MKGRILLALAAAVLGFTAPAARAHDDNITRVGNQEVRELRLGGHVDLSQAEDIFGIPKIPVWHETDIETPTGYASRGGTLAAFHGPNCACGRPFGICFDVAAIKRDGKDPNEVLLHELTHAWQYYLDPDNHGRRATLDELRYGYYYAPHEVEARKVARQLNDAGVRVWFPNQRAGA